ncbi:uncharacterized protein [Dermacentor andersoni]|uniref:uncharacterized protein isoform X1 n=1 Tax=Dermacentor andersoni TaxID=34620 RepID=UPI003B3AED9D
MKVGRQYISTDSWKMRGGKLGGLEGRVLGRTGPASAPVDFFGDDAEDTSSDEERPPAVPVPSAPPAAAHASIGTEPGTSDTAPAPQATSATATGRCGLQGSRRVCAGEPRLLTRRPPTCTSCCCRQHHRQLVQELRESRVVQQQLAAEMRGCREATGIIATTLRQLLAALVHGLHEPPQP